MIRITNGRTIISYTITLYGKVDCRLISDYSICIWDQRTPYISSKSPSNHLEGDVTITTHNNNRNHHLQCVGSTFCLPNCFLAHSQRQSSLPICVPVRAVADIRVRTSLRSDRPPPVSAASTADGRTFPSTATSPLRRSPSALTSYLSSLSSTTAPSLLSPMSAVATSSLLLSPPPLPPLSTQPPLNHHHRRGHCRRRWRQCRCRRGVHSLAFLLSHVGTARTHARTKLAQSQVRVGCAIESTTFDAHTRREARHAQFDSLARL